jgi:hypothetical protein
MSQSDCLSYICRHISKLKPGQIFTTRDCLMYGKRSEVDNSLFKLVKQTNIIRLTNGVFARWTSNFQRPTFIEIAKIKAKAFGKQLLIHGADTAAKYSLVSSGNAKPTFYIDGSSSRFRYGDTYVHLKKACKKKMHMPDDKAGLAIRALWHIGERKLMPSLIRKVAPLWDTRAERDKIYRGKAWMPAWLGDKFLTNQYVGPYAPAPITAATVDPGLQAFRDYMKYREENFITDLDPPGLDGNYCVVEYDQEPPAPDKL